MPILYHAPMSRSSTIVSLIRELGASDVEIRHVSVRRMGGKGGPDASNPHPEKKAPYLVDGDEKVRERAAIITYLTDKYPANGLAPLAGEPGRGAYLSWLAYYQGVIEPVLVLHATGITNAMTHEAFRDADTMMATLNAALEAGPWLMGDRFTAADLLCSSPFFWFDGLADGYPALADWVRRCGERPSVQAVAQADALAMPGR